MNIYNVEPKNVFLLYEILNQLNDGVPLSDLLSKGDRGGFHLYRINRENGMVVDLGELGYDTEIVHEKIPRLLFNFPTAIAILYTPDGSIYEIDTSRMANSKSLTDILK